LRKKSKRNKEVAVMKKMEKEEALYLLKERNRLSAKS
jgi:hypothetical protein